MNLSTYPALLEPSMPQPGQYVVFSTEEADVVYAVMSWTYDGSTLVYTLRTQWVRLERNHRLDNYTFTYPVRCRVVSYKGIPALYSEQMLKTAESFDQVMVGHDD